MRARGGPPSSSRGGVGRGRGSFRGGPRFGGRGGSFATGPPQSIVEVGEIMHHCQEELVCKCTLNQQVPYFNGRIFLENKQEIGKIDEILGPIHKFVGENMKATSFKQDTKLYIDPNQVLPLSRFLPKPPIQKAKTGGGTPSRGGRGGMRGGRGGRGGGFSRGGGFRGRGRGS